MRVCFYVLCGHLLGKGWPLGSRLWCLLWVCHFPTGILCQVWYLIVSIPDLCTLTYAYCSEICSLRRPKGWTVILALIVSSICVSIDLKWKKKLLKSSSLEPCGPQLINWVCNNESKKAGKDQGSIQSSTTPDPAYQWESDNDTIRHHKREPRGDDKAQINRHAWKHNKKKK